MPETECDDCRSMLGRIEALEEILSGKTDIPLSMLASEGSVSVTVLGSVIE